MTKQPPLTGATPKKVSPRKVAEKAPAERISKATDASGIVRSGGKVAYERPVR
jgi:hypothetical protein